MNCRRYQGYVALQDPIARQALALGACVGQADQGGARRRTEVAAIPTPRGTARARKPDVASS